jgi:phage gp36-like protein
MAFISKTDLTTIIYLEDIDVITEGDDTKVDSAIAAGIGEAQSYCDRFDVVTLFGRTGTDRDPILFESCKALACWFLVAACPANQNTKDIRERANDARTWLSRVQNGKLKPVNWPPKPPDQNSNLFHVSSYDKRINNY